MNQNDTCDVRLRAQDFVIVCKRNPEDADYAITKGAVTNFPGPHQDIGYANSYRHDFSSRQFTVENIRTEFDRCITTRANWYCIEQLREHPKVIPRFLFTFKYNIVDGPYERPQFCFIDGIRTPNLTTFARFVGIVGACTAFTALPESGDRARADTAVVRHGVYQSYHFQRLDTQPWLVNTRLYLDIPRTREELDAVRAAMAGAFRQTFCPLLLKSEGCVMKYSDAVQRDIRTANAIWAIEITALGEIWEAIDKQVTIEKIMIR